MRQARKKILCIENDDETATLITEDLVERGFEVHVATDGAEGFVAILKLQPDLVLSDISMPAGSGFDVLKRLTAAVPRMWNDMPFIFLTGVADCDARLEARQLGADGFITKPVDFDLLESIIRASLARTLVRQLRQKLEANPSQPKLVISESGVGYRLVGNAASSSRPSW